MKKHKQVELKCPDFIAEFVRCIGGIRDHTPFEDPGFIKAIKDNIIFKTDCEDRENGIIRIDEEIAGVIQHLWKYHIITVGCCQDDYRQHKPRMCISSYHSDEEIEIIKCLIQDSDDVKSGKVSGYWYLYQWQRCEV